MSVMDLAHQTEARELILRSIREHLEMSAAHEGAREAKPPGRNGDNDSGAAVTDAVAKLQSSSSCRDSGTSLIQLFKENVEAVDGHCAVVHGELEVSQVLAEIMASLKTTSLETRRIALSDASVLPRLLELAKIDPGEITIAPDVNKLFGCEVGITTAQVAIAESGTLVLESDRERHRLVSLLPPVHIAILDASRICLTMGEALAKLQRGGREISPAITFVTGPSRTADIELTLAIGVHGPCELFVIVNDGPPLTIN